MINLKEYYKDKIKENDYYFRFYKEIIIVPQENNKALEEAFGIKLEASEDESFFEIFDEEEAIKKFRELCEPNLSLNQNNKVLFYLICYFLRNNGYQIKEFPRLFERPPLEPTEFTTNDIRNMAFSLNLDDNGTVKYQIRRKIVANLQFEKINQVKIDENINTKFQEISTRNAKFESMAIDEKIKEIINLIENLLKNGEKYIELDYQNISSGILNNRDVIDFKKKMQCFRHSSEESLKERSQYNEKQKKFIIDYGIMLCNLIFYNK